MKRNMAVSLCVLLLASCLSSSASATFPLDDPQDANALTSTSTYTLANIAKAHTTAISCAGSSASSSAGGSSVSTAASNASAVNVAAGACAKAIADGFADAGTNCSKADVTAFVSLAATACARATLKLRTAALATAASRGRAAAYSSACATSSAFSAAFAKAIAKAFSTGFSKNGVACPAYTNVTGEANVTAAAKAIAKGLASSFAYAASQGKGASKAVTTALFSADVAVFAKAIGSLFAHGCAQCDWGCEYCTQLPDGDDSSSNTLALSAKGRYALASAFSDAVSSVCFKNLTVEAATNATLQAIGDACVQITATAKGYLTASGNSVSCTNSFASGETVALTKAYGSLVVEAVATAFKNDDCTTKAFSTVTAETFASINETEIVKAFNKACVATRGGFYVSFSSVSKAFYAYLNKNFAKAISDAISGVESVCECSGAGYCCNCAERSPQCPF